MAEIRVMALAPQLRDCISASELLVTLSTEYAGRAPSYRLPAAMVEGSLRSASMRRLLAGTPRESIRYLNHPVRFDTRIADRILGAQGVSCPPAGRGTISVPITLAPEKAISRRPTAAAMQRP